MTFAIIVHNYLGTRVIGPFETREQASGYGLSNFGPLTFGNPDQWAVKELIKP